FRYIVLYQAVKAIYPALASQFVLLMLATSIVSAIGATELFHQAAFIESRTYRSFEVYTLITLSYLLLTVGFRGLFSLVYWAVGVRRPRRRAARSRWPTSVAGCPPRAGRPSSR